MGVHPKLVVQFIGGGSVKMVLLHQFVYGTVNYGQKHLFHFGKCL